MCLDPEPYFTFLLLWRGAWRRPSWCAGLELPRLDYIVVYVYDFLWTTSHEAAAWWNSGYGYFVHGWTDQTDRETAGQSNLSSETGEILHEHRHFDDSQQYSTCEQHSSFLNYDNCCHHALLSEYMIFVGIQLMSFLTQDAHELWAQSSQSTDLFVHVRIILTQILFISPRSLLRVAFHLQMVNSPVCMRSLLFIFAMMTSRQVASLQLSTFSTKEMFRFFLSRSDEKS